MVFGPKTRTSSLYGEMEGVSMATKIIYVGYGDLYRLGELHVGDEVTLFKTINRLNGDVIFGIERGPIKQVLSDNEYYHGYCGCAFDWETFALGSRKITDIFGYGKGSVNGRCVDGLKIRLSRDLHPDWI